jgi:hypothetical protein
MSNGKIEKKITKYTEYMLYRKCYNIHSHTFISKCDETLQIYLFDFRFELKMDKLHDDEFTLVIDRLDEVGNSNLILASET